MDLAVWQYHLASLPSEFYTEFWNGLPLEIYITSYELQMLLQFAVACSWAILLKPWCMTSPFKLPSQCKICSSPAPFLKLTCARLKIREKGEGFLSREFSVVGFYHQVYGISRSLNPTEYTQSGNGRFLACISS